MSEPRSTASSAPAGPDAPPTRRALLEAMAAAGAGLGLLAHGCAWTRALVPEVLYEPPTRRRIGPPSTFPDGVTFVPDAKVFLVRAGPSLRALSAVCTHLGCTVSREGNGSFQCPCHGSRFDPQGANTGGPAPRPLPWRPLELSGDGQVVVDLGAEVEAATALVLEKPR